MSSAKGTVTGYTVEVRATIAGPRKLGTLLIGTEWTAVPTTGDTGGIRNPIYNTLAKECGLMAYVTALGVMASVDAEAGFASGLEFRLVRHALEYSWSITRNGVSEPTNFLVAMQNEKFTEEPAAPPTEKAP